MKRRNATRRMLAVLLTFAFVLAFAPNGLAADNEGRPLALISDAGSGMDEVLGYIDTPILMRGGALGDNGASTGGNWITGLMLQWAREYGAVAAFFNRGGISTDLDIPDGETTREITVGDIYAVCPFADRWLIYELTGEELARQLYNGLNRRNFGDQLSGLTFTYYQLGTGEEDGSEYEIAGITLSDGTAVDIHDTKTVYRVCVGSYSAARPGSVFEGKTPVIPMEESPIGNETMAALLRAGRAAGNDKIPVDTGARAQRLPVCALHEDVSTSAWCHDAVDYVMANGLMLGISGHRFGPSLTVSRAMAVVTLYRLAGKPGVSGLSSAFTDAAQGKWYSDAIVWASKNEIISGYTDGRFGINDAVSREQLVTILWRYFGEEQADGSALASFADASAVSTYARQAFAWAVEKEIVHGTAKGLLDPKGSATRAELAQILYGLHEGQAAGKKEDGQAARKLIIDTDTGADDVSALILAAKTSGVEILGVTTLMGNTDLEQATKNALMALELAGCDAPVYKGADATYSGRKVEAFSVFGKDGMGEADLIHPTGQAQAQDAVSFILDTVRANPGEIEIVALGPATNIALAIERDPETMRKVKMIWSMGTAGLGPGNASPVAEFNVYGDAEAYRVMLDFDIPITIIGLDMCGGKAQWTGEQFDDLDKTGEIGHFVATSFRKLREFYASNGSADETMNCDGLAMLCVLRPDFVKGSIKAHGSCITQPGETYAQVIFYKEGFTYNVVANDFDHNITLITKVDQANYYRYYKEAVCG